MKLRVLQLGTEGYDIATELRGLLTHWSIDMGKRVSYLLQPKGTSPEDGAPVDKIQLEIERIHHTEDQFEEVDIPFEILGTKVTDKGSGFTGMAVAFIRHINGCFHVVIQPPGALKKTGCPVRRRDFDLRQCEGDKIPDLSPEKLAQSKKERPSPDSTGEFHGMMSGK